MEKSISIGGNMDNITKKEVVTGDIILYHGDSLLAKLIQFFDGTEMNHASVYLGEGMVGEALVGGLTKRTIEDSMIKSLIANYHGRVKYPEQKTV